MGRTEVVSVVQKRLTGRPVVSTSSKRYVDLRREQTSMRMWRQAPDVLSYVVAVALGKEPVDEGRLKAAGMILSRCIPTVTSQEVRADTTSISTTIGQPEVLEMFNARLGEISAYWKRNGDADGS
jgi:hypothetical protein